MSAPSTAFVQQYKDTIAILVQQQDSRLEGTVMVDRDFKGKAKFYDQYGADEMTEIMTRYADTPIQLPNHQRRKLTPRYFVSNTLEDPVDALEMLIDPKSAYMQGKVYAANRKKDDIIITALGGTSYTGETGASSQALTSGQKVVVGTSGLSKSKCLSAKKILDAAEVDEMDRYFCVTSTQMEDLLTLTEVTSADYNIVKPLYEGTVKTWLGFTWKRSERLTTDDSDSRLCYAWQKKGIQMGIQKDITGRVDERPDKNYAWQVYLKVCMGATRLEEERVVEIACAES